jgi:hypothetical protein
MRGPHLHPLGTQGKGGGHGGAVGDAAGGDNRHIELSTDLGEQHDCGDWFGALEASALTAFDHQAVDTRGHRFGRGAPRRHHVGKR